MNKLFAPFSIIIGLVAGTIAKRIFTKVWGEIRDEEPPSPDVREFTVKQLIPALIVEGAIARLVRGLVDNGLRHAWAGSMGVWPGDEHPDPE